MIVSIVSFLCLVANGLVIATLADLRAAMLSIVINNARGIDRKTTTKPRYCWLYHHT